MEGLGTGKETRVCAARTDGVNMGISLLSGIDSKCKCHAKPNAHHARAWERLSRVERKSALGARLGHVSMMHRLTLLNVGAARVVAA